MTEAKATWALSDENLMINVLSHVTFLFLGLQTPKLQFALVGVPHFVFGKFLFYLT